jgi:transposase
MPAPKRDPAKLHALREQGSLHRHPAAVTDALFQQNPFFDPRDVVQVKYELLRRVSIDKVSVTEASGEYGVSRPTYYQAKADFDVAGIAGLVPAKPGPRGPHKVDDDVLAFLRAQVVAGEPLRARELAKLVRDELDIELHPTPIERVIKKTGR